MCKKTFCKWLLKFAAAGLAAFLILNLVCRFYYYIPWNEPSPNGATDFVFPSSFRGYNGVEGFASIAMDENGYNNPSVPQRIDILCMGSSHSLGYCVEPGQSWPELLAAQLDGQTTYNISTFSHALVNCLGNLDAALEAYQPGSYVVIEFPNAVLDYEALCALNRGAVPELDQVTGPLMKLVKRFPYLQLAGHQISNLLNKGSDVQTIHSTDKEQSVSMDAYAQALDTALENALSAVQQRGCQLILVYHANFELDETGAPIPETSPYLEAMESLCQENGITLLNAQQAFMDDYRENKRVHYGFSNTAPNTGHLNAAGNEVIARQLAALIG